MARRRRSDETADLVVTVQHGLIAEKTNPLFVPLRRRQGVLLRLDAVPQ